jgi:hypothetical protein
MPTSAFDGAGGDEGATRAREDAQLIHRDNTFGTPEEDAFRRDFTVNALFYDIASFSIIDYVGGLDDLREGVIRCIGDPEVRFKEDPVRMLRALALAARLDFTIEDAIYDAIGQLRHEIANSSAPRLLEEYTQDPARRLLGEDVPGLSAPACLNRFHRNCTTARAPHCGSRCATSTPTARSSPRRRTRSPTRCCSAACWRRLASPRKLAAHHAAMRTSVRANHSPGWGPCRWLVATSSGSARSSACSDGCAT